LTDDDQIELEQILLDRANAGKVIQGTGGLRKLRHAPLNRGGGKSGGARVCYAYLPRFATIYFVVAFAKNEKENLTPRERHAIRVLLHDIEDNLKRSQP
jgi:hypothetical protein